MSLRIFLVTTCILMLGISACGDSSDINVPLSPGACVSDQDCDEFLVCVFPKVVVPTDAIAPIPDAARSADAAADTEADIDGQAQAGDAGLDPDAALEASVTGDAGDGSVDELDAQAARLDADAQPDGDNSIDAEREASVSDEAGDDSAAVEASVNDEAGDGAAEQEASVNGDSGNVDAEQLDAATEPEMDADVLATDAELNRDAADPKDASPSDATAVDKVTREASVMKPIGRCECRDPCGDGRRCTVEGAGGECIKVGCTSDKQCGPSESCQSGSCIDLSGECSSGASCRVPRVVTDNFPVTCRGTCQLDVVPGDSPLPNFLVPLPRVAMKFPKAWSQVDAPDALRFEWDPAPKGAWSLVVLTNQAVQVREGAEQMVVWAAVVEKGGKAHWDDGSAVKDGVLTNATPLLDAGIYYAAALHIQSGRIVGGSAQSIVRIGGDWPQPGDDCDVQLPYESCQNPTQPQVCVDGTCRLLCASHDDCSRYLNASVLCGRPISKTQPIRVCPLWEETP